MSSQPPMVNPRQVVRAIVFALLLSMFSAASVSLAYAQSFTLTVLSPLTPPAVDPGGSSVATLDLQPVNNFDSLVSLTCAVTTSDQQAVSLPTCAVSPASTTPPDSPALTVSTTSTTSAGQYTVTVTATSGSISQPINLALGVQDVSEDYTLSVSPTVATPNPVAAGSQATTTVTVTPIASYSGEVTLACLSVLPVVTPSPVCSFNPPAVAVGSSTIQPTSILTITTSGPAPTTRLWDRRIFYALWLALPGLVLVGVGATGALKKKMLGIFLLTAMGSGLLFLPSCSSSPSTNNNGVTPSNTYTFTLTGADANGAAPSSTTLTTVSVTVN